MADRNGGPLAGLKGYLTELDRCDDLLDVLRADYMNECKPIRDDQAEIMKSAKEAGLNMKSFRAIARKHRADRRHDKLLGKLDLADLSDYKSMEDALGDFIDTPLGQAAKAREDAGEERPEPMF